MPFSQTWVKVNTYDLVAGTRTIVGKALLMTAPPARVSSSRTRDGWSSMPPRTSTGRLASESLNNEPPRMQGIWGWS